MKKILVLVLTVVLALSIVGCGKSEEEESTKEKLKENSTAQDSQADKNVDNTEKNKEVKAEKIKIGETMNDGKVEVTLNNIEFTSKIMPKEQPAGYSFYEAENDQIYINIDADVKNLQEDNLQGDKIMTVTAKAGDDQYKGFAAMQDADRGFAYAGTSSIAPAGSNNVAFIIECPKDVEKEKSVTLAFDLDGKKYEYTMKK